MLAALLAVAAAALLFIVGSSLAVAAGDRSSDLETLMLARSVELLTLLWVFAVGCSIGSFLNVVAWRLPRGESIGGRSRCPGCGVTLLARDNCPLLSYLVLGGRCRGCGQPISIRYPVVELSVGICLTIVVGGEIFGFGLPYQRDIRPGRPAWAALWSAPVLMTAVYHAAAVSLLWAGGLIRFDGQRLPAPLWWTGWLLVVVPLLVVPQLMVVPWQADVAPSWQASQASFFDAVLRVITALAAAVFWGRLLGQSWFGGADPKLDPLGESTARLIDLVGMLSVALLVVGWQASPALIVLALLLSRGLPWLLHSVPPRDSVARFAIALPIAVTLQLAAWRPLHDAPWYPSAGSPPWIFLAWSGLVIVSGWRLPRGRDRAERTPDEVG